MPGTSNQNLFARSIAMKVSLPLIIAGVLATLAVIANCQKTSIQPVAIEANEMCSFCKMDISEKRYAAEFIDADGQAFKFDDIGCMANFINQKKTSAPVRARFVMDFNRHEWLNAESAFYVRSSEFKTPMSGNIVAFRDEAGARDAAAKYHGALLLLDDLIK